MIEFFYNLTSSDLLSPAVFILVVLFLKILEKTLAVRLKKIAQKSSTKIDDLFVDILESFGWPLYVILAAVVSLQFIDLPVSLLRYFYYFAFIVVAGYAVLVVQKILFFLLSSLESAGKIDVTISSLLKQFGKLILWTVALLVILQNLGFNITTFIAGMGIGGVAIAFALQNVLGDVFAYFTIHFDKPFTIGDFIIMDGDMGVIEKVGIKSTRIRALSGEQLVISNKELTEKRVHNYKKMAERRISFNFSLLYETPSAKLEKIPQIMSDIFLVVKETRLDRAHFKEFGDYGLIFEVVYYVLTSDYNKYMDIQQELNFALKSAIEKEGMEFAYPTQKIFLHKG
jgi:small-conductance mechanosensitive channel